MGFGILFISYLLSFFISLVNYGYVIRLAGYAMMALALLKLREYGREFTYPLVASVALIVYGIYDFVYQGAGAISVQLPSFFDAAFGVMEYISIGVIVVFNVALLYAVYSITSRLELYKQRNAAVRNIIFVLVYFVLTVLAIGPLRGNTVYTKYFGLPTLLLQLAWIILNSVLIFSCYMYICPEGDEDMPRKKSKFGFIDKLIDESDRRMEQASKDTQEYIKQKHQEKMDRSNNNQKRRKK